mmetsp:Transcript_31718/g.67226  ORF Transcript_31718/g.67226 Transcript_31718/m.67226 type:complete len:85 (-) Transcript_31718:1889-2143(-)
MRRFCFLEKQQLCLRPGSCRHSLPKCHRKICKTIWNQVLGQNLIVSRRFLSNFIENIALATKIPNSIRCSSNYNQTCANPAPAS